MGCIQQFFGGGGGAAFTAENARSAMALPVVPLGDMWTDKDTGDVASATGTTLVKTDAGWTVNEHDGAWAVITAGTGAGQAREIASNTADTLTVDPAWTTNPDATSDFSIRTGRTQAIDWGGEKQAATATVGGAPFVITKGVGWPATGSADVVLDLTVSSLTTINWTIAAGGAANWPDSFAVGLHTILLRSRGGTIRAYYGGMVEAL